MKIKVMKKILIFQMILMNAITNAQNLVSNPSFEDTLQCPDNLDQLNKAIGWGSYRATPDYFNSCSSYGGYVGVPLNQFDFQNPKTGNAYVGFFTKTASPSYREYVGSQLIQPLIIGHSYFISFFVNRVGVVSAQRKNIATNKIGIRFTTIPFSFANPLPIDNFAQLYTDSIITDTLNWTQISGFFTSDSMYNYFAIGSFFEDSLISIIKFDSLATAAYYFLDDINITDSIPTGIKDNNLIKVSISPNPARDWIELEGRGIKSVEIINALGSKIGFYPTTTSTLLHLISLSSLCPGIYFLKINMIDERISFQKFIIKN
jgi:OOP family OmpA-OmpF porin